MTSGKNQRSLDSWDKLLDELSDADEPPPPQAPNPRDKKHVRPPNCTAPNFAHTPAGMEGDLSFIQDGGIQKKLLNTGSGFSAPHVLWDAEFHLSGWHSQIEHANTIIERKVIHRIREQPTALVPLGLETGLRTMAPGEVASFRVEPQYGYGAEGTQGVAAEGLQPVPPSAILFYKVEMIGFTMTEVVTRPVGSVPEEGDFGVVKATLIAGQGSVTAGEKGCRLWLSVRGFRVAQQSPGDIATREPDPFMQVANGWWIKDGPLHEGWGGVAPPNGLVKVLSTMRAGEKCTATLQPGYAFGAHGLAEAAIPAGQVVEYEIGCTKLERFVAGQPDRASAVVRLIAEDQMPVEGAPTQGKPTAPQHGDGNARIGDDVTVSFCVEQDGELVDEGVRVSWRLGGEETEQSVWAGRLEGALCSMRPNTKALVQLRGEFASDSASSDESEPRADVTLELHSIISNKQLTGGLLFDFACACRAAGNAQFRGGHLWRALHKYELSLEVIGRGKQSDEGRQGAYRELRRDVMLNIAACSLPLQLWKKAEYTCTAALEIEQANLKGLLRRSRALAAMGRFDEARRDLRKLLSLEPNNKTAVRELGLVGKQLGAQVQSQREFFCDFYSGYREGQVKELPKAPRDEDDEEEYSYDEIREIMRQQTEENQRNMKIPAGCERGGVIPRRRKKQ